MPRATIHFPEGFYWGTATAAHQVEGRNSNNSWSAWEQMPGKIAGDATAGLACDWWGGRWKEDMDRAVETGQNAHRFSVEWSRIQPAPDRWDEDALDFYREMARGMVERKITPMVTLHHFTDPLWMFEPSQTGNPLGSGGWERDDAPELFAKFVQKVVGALKEYVNLWITINEPNVYLVGGWLGGAFPPGKNDPKMAMKVVTNLIKGHAAAYKIIHELQPQAQVGIAHHFRNFSPARPWFLPDRILANMIFKSFNNGFVDPLATGRMQILNYRTQIPEAAGTQDFIGINYYSNDLAKFILDPKRIFMQLGFPPDALLSPSGFIANMPEGMFSAMKWAKQYGKPIFITENGVEDATDLFRPRYLIEHLFQVWRAVNFNWPIKGYFHWSLVDNFEWERAWDQRFGLWGLDITNQMRIRRRSVDLYAAICHENGISSAMVEEFAPQIVPLLYPE
jgi:beta-glucosidase